MNNYFRVYTNPDIVGVEIGAALKNVIALAAGISDGLGYGDNAKAALITRGLSGNFKTWREDGCKSTYIFRFDRSWRFDCHMYECSFTQLESGQHAWKREQS